jgi:ubiquinone/menaquinone biosynthesis C-methylase UbiE
MSANPIRPGANLLPQSTRVADRTGNLKIYRNPEVVAHYAQLDYLSACERFLFDKYISPGAAVLDLGVGGGRTTAYLSRLSSRYVGLDYSEEMVNACRAKFPGLQFEVADAADLSRFTNDSFDAVVFSFNGMDYLSSDEKRHDCLREFRRVLKDRGTLIFSSHNPRSVIVGWGWDWNRLQLLARKVRPRFFYAPALAALCCAKLAVQLRRVIAQSTPRLLRRVVTRAFWRGDGYLLDRSHGGLWTHCATTQRVVADLNAFDLKILESLPEDYPRKSNIWSTRWFYYAFSK